MLIVLLGVNVETHVLVIVPVIDKLFKIDTFLAKQRNDVTESYKNTSNVMEIVQFCAVYRSRWKPIQIRVKGSDTIA